MRRHLDDLKQQVEQVLRWEQSSHWQFRDFETLSQLVYQHTRQRVDAHDLQRFWQPAGTAPYQVLDILACFVDYEDWDDFYARNFYGEVNVDDEVAILHAPMWGIPMRWVILICWLSVIASVAVAVLLVWKQ